MNAKEIHKGILEIHLDSWETFPSFVKKECLDTPACIYRGQSSSEWKVESTVDRLEQKHTQYTIPIEGKNQTFECPPIDRNTHLRAFQEAARGRLDLHIDNEDEWWVLGQHHGLATPMLDWTYYPFVALFFAFEKENEAESRAVYILSSSSIRETDLKVISFSKALSPRQSCQGSILLKMPEPEAPEAPRDLESYIQSKFENDTYSTDISTKNIHPRNVLTKVVIKNTDRENCLKYLNKMNINRMSLFPDIDGAAKYINALWEINFDTSMGYFIE